VEGEKRHSEERHEAVDPGALVRGEDAPPPDGAVRQDHGDVERHHGRHHVVEVRARDHLAGALGRRRSYAKITGRLSASCLLLGVCAASGKRGWWRRRRGAAVMSGWRPGATAE